MKAIFLVLFLAVFAFSCSDDNDTMFSVTPELSTYVESFYTEAALRGVNPPKTNLVAKIDTNCQSSIQISKDDEQWIMTMDKEIFDSMTAAGNPNNKIESMIFHELGRIILNRELSSGNSIMNGNIKMNGYTNAQRSALIDELFQ